MPADVAINKIRRGLVRELSSRRFQDALKELDEKEYLKFCIDVMEFCLPKLQRVEVEQTTTIDLSLLTEDELRAVSTLIDKVG